MVCGVIKQCQANTKHNCQCKKHVTNNGDFCELHSRSQPVSTNQPVSTIVNQPVSTNNVIQYNIPENIFVNGKFVPNVNRQPVPIFNKPKRESDYTPVNWTGV